MEHWTLSIYSDTCRPGWVLLGSSRGCRAVWPFSTALREQCDTRRGVRRGRAPSPMAPNGHRACSSALRHRLSPLPIGNLTCRRRWQGGILQRRTKHSARRSSTVRQVFFVDVVWPTPGDISSHRPISHLSLMDRGVIDVCWSPSASSTWIPTWLFHCNRLT
jgi:hypothetical protein